MSDDREQCCRTCRFADIRDAMWRDPLYWHMNTNCRRHAPQRTEQLEYQTLTQRVWPVVKANDWCGDWEQWTG